MRIFLKALITIQPSSTSLGNPQPRLQSFQFLWDTVSFQDCRDTKRAASTLFVVNRVRDVLTVNW